MSPHQDSSHVDERKTFSVYAWIPLQNVNKWNVVFIIYLKVIHGVFISGLLNVEWPLKDKVKELSKMMEPLKMKKGEVLFFHSALIHSSPPNYTFKTRVAINYYLHPKDHPFLHFYEDKETPEGKVEMFEVTPEYFYNEDFERRPSEKYPLIEVIDKTKIRKEVLKQLI
ncbi:MAG: phytanoyl-CoA dioxygenase family protein [Chitinophagales bacterium]